LFKFNKTFDGELERKYNRRFKKYGATAEGSYWINTTRQNLRFEIMLQEVIKLHDNLELSIGDIGCGYGALAQYISTKHLTKNMHYFGCDISKELINYCHKNYNLSWADFVVGSKPHSSVDICLISGTFNLTATKNLLTWENYIFKNLTKCWLKTKKALIFNLQTSDVAHISDGNIFYGDRNSVARRCNILFGPTFFVDHIDLPYDTTFVVQKGNMG
jgi:SAM-dependent methyltransferase